MGSRLSLTILLVIVLVLGGISGCGGDSSSDDGNANPESGDSTGDSGGGLGSNDGSGGGDSGGDESVSRAAAARFLDQATFGATESDVERVRDIGMERWIDQQFDAPMSNWGDKPCYGYGDDDERRDDGCARTDHFRNHRWFDNALTGPDQLRQRVAFALSQIWVVSEKNTGNDFNSHGPHVNWFKVLNEHALGNYFKLMKAATKNPMMGDFLDMACSRRPAEGELANENYARELLQLFTLGIHKRNMDATLTRDGNGNPIPVYDGDQVQAFARAFTGWGYSASPKGRDMGKQSQFCIYNNDYASYKKPMRAGFPKWHDSGAKTLLNGKRLPAGQSAEEDLNAALRNIFNHPNMAPFVSKQLIQHLVTSNPSAGYVRRVARTFAGKGDNTRGDLKAVVRQILLDPEARRGDDPAKRQQRDGHLREPILFMTGLIRSLGGEVNPAQTKTNHYGDGDVDAQWGEYFFNQGKRMGQPLHEPLSVFSFYPPDYVSQHAPELLAPEFATMNTSTALERTNFVDEVVSGAHPYVRFNQREGSEYRRLAKNDPDQLLDRLDTMLLHGGMSEAMQNEIRSAMSMARSPKDKLAMATYLVATSPHYQVLH